MNAWTDENRLRTKPKSTGERPSCASRVTALHLVTAAEVEQLRGELRRGAVPTDLDAKLHQLLDRDLAHQSLAHACLWFIALLQATFEGAFTAATPQEIELMLQVVAYLRKDEDAIPDLQPNGYSDDQQEARSAVDRLRSLVLRFKQWRLQHVVPRLWADRAL